MKRSTEELLHLKRCLQREVMISDKPFSWLKTCHKALKCPDRRFHFWWRLASYLHHIEKFDKLSKRINRNLRNKYGLDIKLGAHIGEGLTISHYVGIVISDCCIIGKNFYIKQNSTIGVKHTNQKGKIIIGDNVEVCANSCIIGENISIGSNVIVGAMSFINKSIPDNCTVISKKVNKIIIKSYNAAS